MGSFYLSEYATNGSAHVIRVGGYVDFAVSPQLKSCLVRRIEAGDRMIVVELPDAGFIDSTAIGVLVGALKRLREVGGSLAVVCDNDNVRSIFEIVGLEKVVPLYSSRDDALAAFAQAA
jgi:anti-sigma B factor antagonist